MDTISMAYAKAHLPELVERASQGERITIVRYKKPVAELGPSSKAETTIRHRQGKGISH